MTSKKPALNKRNVPKFTAHTSARFRKIHLGVFGMIFAGLGSYALIGSFAATAACTDTATSANVVSKAENAPAGAIICLTGAYGSKTFSASRSGMVTLRPANGTSASINPTVYGSGYIFDGLTITGLYTNGAKNTQFINSAFTGMSRIDTPADVTDASILFDHNTFDTITMGPEDYEGRLTIRGYNNTSTVGVVITNNHFGNGGSSDGIQIIGDAYGVQVGPGNEFSNIRQEDAIGGAHVDPLQLYGSKHSLINGNYFHDNSTGIMAPNGGDSETITNNIFVGTGYAYGILLDWAQNSTVAHNTVTNANIRLEDWTNGTDHPSEHTSGTVRNNVVVSGAVEVLGTNNTATADYNLHSAGGTTGVHDAIGAPTFTGGANPTSWAGFALATGSKGKGVASDGLDMGTTYFSGSSTPTGKTGDLNGDNLVNIFDLSILLSNYGKPQSQSSNAKTDLNSDGAINIFDLSILLSNYGK